MSSHWNELLEFESRDLLERYINCKHNRNVSSSRVNEIISNFKQGREFFESLNVAGNTVKPLLLYYGVLALSRGLILTLCPTRSEDSLKPSHGLEIKNWTNIIKNKDFENLKIVIGNGSLSELLVATNNENYFRANSTAVNYKTFIDIPKKGSSVLFGDLMRCFPDFQREYKVWLEKDLIYGVLNRLEVDEDLNRIRVDFQPKINHESIKSIFPEEYCIDIHFGDSPNLNVTTVSFRNTGWHPNVAQKWNGPFGISDACIVPPMPQDICLNMIGNMFIISYVFGMMSRYFPTTWISLRRGEKGDKVYPIANGILKFIEEKYPIVTLDFLKNFGKNNFQN